MRQVTQRLRDGRIEVMDVPSPVLTPHGVIVDVRASLLSAGTERSTVEAARSSLIGKARARPEQARQVVQKARTDGLRATVDAVRTRLDHPSPLGYSSAGVVIEVGARVGDIRPGDHVACGGGGYAVHAELNHVPGNLCVPLPDGVPFDAGAFATVGSIAMHGVRQATPQLGERVAVIGLGLVGQLTVRLLRAAGCDVVGLDLDADLVRRVTETGALGFTRDSVQLDNPPSGIANCDAVIITAATPADDPIRLAGAIGRDRARVVVVGEVGMDLPRSSYYAKELELRLSRSYGPGRYDHEYEERGLDYPIGYVRWTERRNMNAFVSLLADRRISVEDLITLRVPITEAEEVYERLVNTSPTPLGLILTYGSTSVEAASYGTGAQRSIGKPLSGAPTAGVIGAGSFAQRLLIPSLRDAGFALSLVASATGLSAASAAKRFGFERACTTEELLSSEELDAVCIASRHGSHAPHAIAALERGKAVFVEKPPAIAESQLEQLRRAARGQRLQVGFNRRHAPLAQQMRGHIADRGHPIELTYRVAAVRLPESHWLNDPEDGGGRLIGEGCHFVDFACWFVGAMPIEVSASVSSGHDQLGASQRFVIVLTFSDGSLATVSYGTESAPRIAKEVVEAHSAGRSALLDDYGRLDLYDQQRKRSVRGRGRDKGHAREFVAFRELLGGTEASGPDPLDTMEVTLRALANAGQT